MIFEILNNLSKQKVGLRMDQILLNITTRLIEMHLTVQLKFRPLFIFTSSCKKKIV